MDCVRVDMALVLYNCCGIGWVHHLRGFWSLRRCHTTSLQRNIRRVIESCVLAGNKSNLDWRFCRLRTVHFLRDASASMDPHDDFVPHFIDVRGGNHLSCLPKYYGGRLRDFRKLQALLGTLGRTSWLHILLHFIVQLCETRRVGNRQVDWVHDAISASWYCLEPDRLDRLCGTRVHVRIIMVALVAFAVPAFQLTLPSLIVYRPLCTLAFVYPRKA